MFAMSTPSTDQHLATPRESIQRFITENGASKALLAQQSGISRQKMHAFLEPPAYERHRLSAEDFGAIATLVNLKTHSRFTADDVRADYVTRGGTEAPRRAATKKRVSAPRGSEVQS